MWSRNYVIGFVLQCGLETMYWTSFSHFVIWGSMIFYFGLTFILYWDSFEYIYVGVAVTIDSNPNFWFTLPLTVVALTVPIMLMKFYASLVHPSLVDKLRRKQILLENANLSTSVELAEYFREVSSMYGSPRSGYVSTTDKSFGKMVSCTSKIGFNACADHDTVTQM